MSTNVFEVWSRRSSIPLTIFADDSFEAENAFMMWCLVHRLEFAEAPTTVEEKDDQWLADRPQLAAAVARAREVGLHDGVFQFLSHRAGWVVASELSQQLGAIAAPEPAVRAYHVRIAYEGAKVVDALVFARSAEHAHAIYKTYRRHHNPARIKVHQIEEFSRWKLTGDQTVLREQMDMGFEGVAAWTSRYGWSIYPPDCNPEI